MIVAAPLEVLGVRPREVDDAVLFHLDDARRDLGHEPAIVRDEEHRPFERLARVGFEAPDEDTEERRLAEPIRADDADALAAAHRKAHVREDALRPIGLREILGDEDVFAALALGLEAEARRAAGGVLELLDFDLLDLLEAALRLSGLRGLG